VDVVIADVGTQFLREAKLLLTLHSLERVAVLSPQELHQNVAAEILVVPQSVKVQIRFAPGFVHSVIPHQLAQRTTMHRRLVNKVDGANVGIAPHGQGEADELVDDHVDGRQVLQLVCLQIGLCQDEEVSFAGGCIGSLLSRVLRIAFLALLLRPGERIFDDLVFLVDFISFRCLVFDVGFECLDPDVDAAQITGHYLWVVVFEIRRFCWICEPLRRTSCSEELGALGHEVGVDCEPLLLVERLFAYYNVEGAREVVPENGVSRCFRTCAEELLSRN
jgi:hypothetical protein